MSKLHTHRTALLALTLALLTLTISFASWRAQAERSLFGSKAVAVTKTNTIPVAPPMFATLTVTNTNDNGAGSLRQAIADAAAGDTITFSVTGTITLTSGELAIDKNLTIQGPGANQLTISGNNASRVFNINSGFTVTMDGLTIANGKASGSGQNTGGGIANYGTLNVTNCTLSGNSASGSSDDLGGGIYNSSSGTLNVTNSTLSGNSASGGTDTNRGGGIASYGTLNVINTTFSGNSASGGTDSQNRGSGIFNGGTLNVTNSTLSGNSVSGGSNSINQGGGIFNLNSVAVNARNTIIAGNTATAGSDVNGAFSSQGNNLIGNGDGSSGFTHGTNGDKVGTTASPINPLLAPLGNYGGPTNTMRPLPGSPALDMGTSTGAPATDQRGVARPQNSIVDIGAVEVFKGAMSMIQLTVDPATNAAGAAAELSNAILLANDDPAATTIKLLCGSYSYSTANNWEYGPNALPPITSDITMEGNGAVLDSTATTRLRFFYVSGGLSYDSTTQMGMPTGKLTLRDLTLKNGKQKGGDSNGGGGGMGAGGAIFNQGELTLERVTLNQNSAIGGNAGVSGAGSGGGGMGQDAQGNNGGGFGGAPLGKGGSGGTGASASGGGGGFRPVDNGLNPSGSTGGNGGGQGRLGGGSVGDGGKGGNNSGFGSGGSGGGFGGGGVSIGVGGGGGGVGGGGGGGVSNISGGGGGFGGGIGFGGSGGGGFGGGGGGFGGGFGGGGFGGAIFNHRGTLSLINTTFTTNTAQGGGSTSGGGGSGFGGALFNLNGIVNVTSSTLAANTVTAGTGSVAGSADGGAIYNLAFGNKIEDGTASVATVMISNTILATTAGGTNDLVNNRVAGTAPNTATVTFSNGNLVMAKTSTGGATESGSPTVTANPNLGALAVLINCVAGTCKPAVLPLPTNSPAINAATGTSPATDATGTARPQGSASDLGAYELCCQSSSAVVSGGVTICPGGMATVTVTVTGGVAPYTVTLTNSGGTLTGASPLMFTVSPAATTTYAVASATDALGCAVTASGSAIIALETQPPIVTPGTIASCYPTVAAAEAAALAATSATDNCPGTLTEIASTAGTCSAVITVTTTDGAGNATAVTYNTRIDNTAPTVTVGTIAANYLTVAAAEAAALAATSATDNCPGALTEVASTVGTCSAVVTVTTTDGCGNATAVTYNTRIDNTAPTVTIGTIASCYPTTAAAEASALAATSATDNCPGALTEIASTVGTCSAVITVTTTDGAGNATAVTYNTRIDNTAPTVTVGTIAANYSTVAAAEAAALAATSATDNCPGTLTETASTVGTCSAVITVTTTDGCGNATAVTYNTRIDNAPPTVTVPANISTCATTVTFTATATDDCNTPAPTVTCTPASGSTFAVGTTTVSCTATDAAGNTSAPSTFTVTVNAAPVASAGAAQTICPTATTAALGGNTPPFGTTGAWTSNSGGTFAPNATTPNATWTAPAGFTGLATLTWTVSSTASPACGTTQTATVPVTVRAVPALSINDVSVTEGNSGTTAATFTVTLSFANVCNAVTVNYATANGTAAGSDYVATSGVLTFASGETTKPLTVLVNGDTTGEPNETFFVNLSGATNATIAPVSSFAPSFTQSAEAALAGGQGIATILDDDFARASLSDPLACAGAGDLVNGLIQLANPSASTQAFTLMTTFTNLVGLPNTCTVTGAQTVTACTVTATGLTASGTLAAGAAVSVTYQAQIADSVSSGTVSASSVATIGAVTPPSVTASLTVNCPQVGPGALANSSNQLSDQKPGSVLLYPVYTSDASNGAAQNARLSFTNTNPSRAAFIHLFFVDGTSCSVADSYICLTPNQTAAFLASDIDPGTTGYVVAVATDRNGCPINFNYLIGDEYVKFASGHQANLAAESIAALAGGLTTCNANVESVQLNFNGTSYNALPRVLAASNLPSRADGNDTLLIVNRIGGNLGTGAATLGTLFGLLYDDAEKTYSFSLPAATCQSRGSLTNDRPRVVPRYDQVIGAGRTGWLKLSGSSDIGILGAQINRNANAASNAGAFNQGHNLHKLTLTTTASVTMPVFPPTC